MNLIYASSYRSASDFARHNDLMPGDWKWIEEPRTLNENPRADLYRVPHWDAHPRRNEIDAALQRAEKKHRLGRVTDCS